MRSSNVLAALIGIFTAAAAAPSAALAGSATSPCMLSGHHQWGAGSACPGSFGARGNSLLPAARDAGAPVGAGSPAGQGGRVPTPAELRQIYSDRTWKWADGGAYFDPDGTFSAVVGNSAKTAYLAKGHWRVDDRGAMCFSAVWRGQSGSSDKKSCFEHRMQGAKILQRKGESGDWYAFKAGSSKRTDEFHKLVAGDRLGQSKDDIRSKYLSGIML